MKVEVVEFYLFKNDIEKRKLRGTMHIFLPEHGLDIRGCLVFADHSRFHATLPHLSQVDDTGELQKFPVVGFLDLAKNEELKKEFLKEAKAYVDKNRNTFLPKEEPKREYKLKKEIKKPFKPHQKPPFKKSEPWVEPLKEKVMGKTFVSLPSKKKAWGSR